MSILNSTDEFIEALYIGILGRPPEPAGLQAWRAELENGATGASVVESISSSLEAQRRQISRRDASLSTICEQLQSYLSRKLCVVDVGAQNLSYEDHCYQSLVDMGAVQTVIGFDPLEEKVSARNREESIADIRPVALGTGEVETLYINNDDATSSLLQINESVMGVTEELFRLKTIDSRQIATTRLDDVQLPDRVDFLKLDIQGYELRVLEHAKSTLDKTLCVHVEAEFQEIYAGQPLFGDIFNYLRASGFRFCDLSNPVKLSSRRFRERFPAHPGSRLFWGDAVFFKETVENPDDLLIQAMISASVYGWLDYTYDLVSSYEERKGVAISGLFDE